MKEVKCSEPMKSKVARKPEIFLSPTSHRALRLQTETKQPLFCTAKTGFFTKWRLKNEHRIPYWWCVPIQIWVVLPISWSKFPMWHDQSEALPRSGCWCVISMEFLLWFLRHHFMGKPVVALWSVGCFLRLLWREHSPENGCSKLRLVIHSAVIWKQENQD